MRPDFLDRYSRLDSPIHRLPAPGKLLVAIALILTLVLAPLHAYLLFAGIGILLLLIALLTGIPKLFLLRRLVLLEPFVLGVAILALFQPHGLPVFIALVIKSTLCLLAMILLSNTTPFSELLHILKTLRVPSLLITTLALMYRYLFVLLDESDRMKRARLSRTFSPRRPHAWRWAATVAAQLFVRASERAERIYAAMCARGWR
jgi:cobalt/nickel transport system permease protein